MRNIFKLFVLLIAGVLLSGCSIGKYEGLTAGEWADEAYYWEDRYLEFRDCVETYDSFDIEEQIDWGGVFYYCE